MIKKQLDVTANPSISIICKRVMPKRANFLYPVPMSSLLYCGIRMKSVAHFGFLFIGLSC